MELLPVGPASLSPAVRGAGSLMQRGDIVIGGHRGMGANILRGGLLYPAWRENTTGSFLAAAATGASFVEFDVQVTRDGVPVLWHDNTLDFGDPSAPTRAAIADLTLSEFRALGSVAAAGGGFAASRLGVVRSFWEEAAAAGGGGGAGAAASVAMQPLPTLLTTPPASGTATPVGGASPAPRLPQRPRGVSPPPRGRSPPRAWRCERDEAFPTLEEVFSALPPNVGFDIEVKMATPDSLAVTPPEEVARVVGPILSVVERCCAAAAAAGQERQVVFSSFDPDVCAALRAAQARWPVLFLTAGGRDGHADARRISLDAALGVALAGGLSGIIADSGALQEDPGFVGRVAARGGDLRVLTYGRENDDPGWVLEQGCLGVHGVICDDVPAVLDALRVNGGAADCAAAAAAGVVAAATAVAEAAVTAVAVAGASAAVAQSGMGAPARAQA